MPDIYIDTDVASGGTGTSVDPYSSITEAWGAKSASLASGETWNFFCRGTTADNVSLLNIDAYNSGVTALKIVPWHTSFGATSDADDGWYQGTANWSTSHYRMVGSDSAIYILNFNNTSGAALIEVNGLQFEHNSKNPGHRCISVEEQSSGSSVVFRGNRFKISGVGTFPRGVRAGSSTASCTLTFENNLLTYGGTQNMSAFNLNDNSFDSRMINNTVVYSGTGGEDFFDDVSGCVVTAYNNVAYAAGGTGSIEFDSVGTLTSDYNASIVVADRGTNGLDCATGDFTTYGTGSADVLTPAASQTNAWGAGGVTNGDQALIPSTDIRGNARNTSAGSNTSIGAFSASGEGAGGTNTDIAIPVSNYSLTLPVPAVFRSLLVSPNLESYSLSLNSPDILKGYLVDTPLESYSLSVNNPTLLRGVIVEVPQETYSVTLNLPSILTGLTISVPTEEYSLSLVAPEVLKGFLVTPDLETYTLTNLNPSFITGLVITPNLEVYTLSLQNPTVTVDRIITPNTETFSLTQQSPSILTGVLILPSVEDYSLSTQNPSILTGVLIAVNPTEYNLTNLTPDVVRQLLISPNVETYNITVNASEIFVGNVSSVRYADIEGSLNVVVLQKVGPNRYALLNTEGNTYTLNMDRNRYE